MRKRVTLFSFLVVLAITLATAATALAKPAPSEAPVLLADPAQAVPNQYIVVLKNNEAARSNKRAVTDMATGAGGTIEFEYDTALHGFAATLPGKALQAIQHNPHVEYVEQVQIWAIDASGDQSGAPWGIDRIDQRDRPLSGTYHWDYDGSGVYAYIIDTGIRITHSQFGGRASYGYNAVGSGNPADDVGHGTHVAGTVGGSTYGVAKRVNLIAVKVCTASGCPTSAIIAGLDWVTRNHNNPAVANMSLGGGASTSIDNAVRNSINSGVFYSIAAGNSNANTCNYSPARVAEALTVGATTSSDGRSSFSNFGSCVDIFAPGSSILSSSYASDTATTTMSGTSMAAPHATGVGALVRQANPGLTPAQVINVIVTGATSGRVSNGGSGSPNLLLYSLLSSGPPPTTPPPTTPPPTTPPPTTPPPTGTVSINAGGSATGSFTADQYFSGGSTYTNTATIDMSQITTNPPAAAVFNTERYGAMTYTIPNRSGAQTVTLYFAETYVTATGQRLFNVSINGSTVLSSFDIYASAGGQNRALARTFNTTANSSGQVVIQFTAVTENPKINGITVTAGSVNPTLVPPTGVPPTAVPPTGVPPTAVPPTGVPPTAVPPTGVPPAGVSINAGGSATGSFTADQYFSGGSTYTNTATIDMSQITSNPPPAAIFNTERYGAMTYTIPNLTAGRSYTVTLYFAETYLTGAGQRLFNVSINGSTALSNFDIYASAGGVNRAIARSFTTTANSSGQVVIQFISGTENPKINGITVAG